MVKMLKATLALCVVLGVEAPLGAATDGTTRAAGARVKSAQTGSSINVVAVRDAAGLLARSPAAGADAIADQLETALRRRAPATALALRRARAWCDRVLGATNTPSTTAGPAVVTQHFEGTGDAEVALHPRTDGAALARIVAQNPQEFSVRSIDAKGEPLATVVDTTGSYDGTRPLNLEAGPTSARLDVTSDGSWSIDIVPLDEAPRVTAPGHYDGVGDEVLIVGGDPIRAHFEADATAGRFAVDGYGVFKAPLVDDASPYSGDVILPTEAKAVLEIRAEGAWSADLR